MTSVRVREDKDLEKLLAMLEAKRDPPKATERRAVEMTDFDKHHMQSLRRFERRDEAPVSADSAIRRSANITVQLHIIVVSEGGQAKYSITPLVIRPEITPTDQKQAYTADGKSAMLRVNFTSGIHISGMGDSII